MTKLRTGGRLTYAQSMEKERQRAEEIKKIKKEVETSLKELKSDMKSNKKYIIIETTKKKSKESENESK
jgi:gas vesicle protein